MWQLGLNSLALSLASFNVAVGDMVCGPLEMEHRRSHDQLGCDLAVQSEGAVIVVPSWYSVNILTLEIEIVSSWI